MRIIIITEFWRNSDGGGIKTYLVNLVETLTEMGHPVKVLFRKGDDPDQMFVGTSAIGFHRKCYNALREGHPDVINNQGDIFCLLSGVIYKSIHGCVLVQTFHSEPERRLPWATRVRSQWLLNRCDRVTFVSERLKERIEEVNGFRFRDTAITYAGVRRVDVPEAAVARFRDEFTINEDAIILLASGMTAVSYKAEGLKLLIRSLSILLKDHPKIVLLVTREGKYSAELKDLAKEIGVEKHVRFVGSVPDPFVPLVLCDVYTHITLGDGLPIALLEAMAFGKPIVATPIAGIPEAITDGQSGILVEPDVESVADGVGRLISNKEFGRELGRRAIEVAEERFTWERSAKKFLDVYGDVGPD